VRTARILAAGAGTLIARNGVMPPDQPVETEVAERREFPRIRLFGDLHGRPVPLQVTLVLQDISVGGFSVESPIDFRPGVQFWFELIGSGSSAMLRATCLHCVRANPFYGDVFFAGFQFTRSEERDLEGIWTMVNDVLKSRS
jgi:hypothetical protein